MSYNQTFDILFVNTDILYKYYFRLVKKSYSLLILYIWRHNMDLPVKFKFGKRKKGELEKLIEFYKFGHTFIAPTSNLWSPDIDIYSIGDKLYVKVDIAGVKVDDINVSFKNGILTIQGRRHDEDRGKKRRYYQMEINYGKFTRRIEFPFELDLDSAEANYIDGFLIVTFRMITDEEKKIKLT